MLWSWIAIAIVVTLLTASRFMDLYARLDRVWMYWTAHADWRRARCAQGMHDCIVVNVDNKHYREHCLYCTYVTPWTGSRIEESTK